MNKQTILRVALLISVSAASSMASPWSMELPPQSRGAFSARRSADQTEVKGTFVRLPNGLVKQTIEQTSGSAETHAGDVLYALEIPGLGFFSQSPSNREPALISAGEDGICPKKTWEGVFAFSTWDKHGANDVSRAEQPVVGTFSWEPKTGVATVSHLFNLTDYKVLPNFKPFTVTGKCKGGKIVFQGSGDRGGTLYLTRSQVGLYFSQTGKSLVVLPGNSIASLKGLQGVYTGIHYHDGLKKGQPIGFTFVGDVAAGGPLSDADTQTNPSTPTWQMKNLKINSPLKGTLTADLQQANGEAHKAICAVHATDATFLFCTTQSGEGNRVPANFAMRLTGRALARNSQ